MKRILLSFLAAASFSIGAQDATEPTHDKVQLWANGPYWATTNVGAEEPEEYGLYFWWGDTVGYKRENDVWVASDGSSSGFSFDIGNTPTYGKDDATLRSEGWITANGVLAPEHDAASVHWGEGWRMPTDAELDALNDNCDWTWTTQNGVNGYVVRGRGAFASASIFLPAAAYGSGTSLSRWAGSDGNYCSSVPYADDPDSAWYLSFDDFGGHYLFIVDRDYGQVVRPVQGLAEGTASDALSDGGAVAAWGYDGGGQCTVPDGTNFVSVAAGYDFSVGLHADGTVEFSGDGAESFNQNYDNSGFVQIDARGESWIGRRADGSVVTKTQWYSDCEIPAEATNPVMVAVGGYYEGWETNPDDGSQVYRSYGSARFSLSDDGSVVGWAQSIGSMPVPSYMNDAVAIAAGNGQLLSLKADGTVSAWFFGGGDDWEGLCEIPEGLTGVKEIAGGGSFSMALLESGRVVVWGDRSDNYGVRHVPAAATNVVEIAAGEYFCMARTADGRVLCWGGYPWNDYGETDVPAFSSRVLGIGAGAYHGLAVVEAAPPEFLDEPDDVSCHVGQPVVLEADVFSAPVAALQWFKDGVPLDGETAERFAVETAVAADSGTYRLVASNAVGTASSRVATVLVDPTPAVDRIHKLTGPAFPGNRLVLRAKPHGDLSDASYVWKRDGTVVATTERLDVAALSPADFGTYTLTVTTSYGTATSEPFVLSPAAAGVPVGWGAGDHGRTTAPEGESGFAQIASGMNFNLGLKTNGTVTAWGYNEHGGCNVPDGLSGVSSVAAGGYESEGAGFAVKNDGTVVAWGCPMSVYTYWDDWAHYDDETGGWTGGWVTYSNGWDTVATMPADLADVVKVAVGGECAIALRADGSVVSWGREWIGGSWVDWYDESGYWGQVFVVTTNAPYATPAGISDVVDIAAGSSFLMALKADGTVVVWNGGDSPYSSETTGECDIPAGLSDVVAIAAGKQNWEGRACFALKADGTIVKWGDRWNQFDIGNATAANAVAVDAGQQHLMALDGNGTVRVWASWDRDGLKKVPPTAAGATGIAAGGYHCTAVVPDSDGDSVCDAEEILLGRDPAVWEDWHRSPLSGTVSVGGGLSPEGALVCVYDASGRLVGRTRASASGAYEVAGLLPAKYYVSVELDVAADDWAGGTLPAWTGAPDPAPGTGWTRGVPPPVTVGVGTPALDFTLKPGQAGAWSRVEAVLEDASDPDAEPGAVALPDGSTVYLNLWPADPDADGIFVLGEVAASHSVFDGTALLPHVVSVKPPEGSQIPRPDVRVVGEEGYVVPARPAFSTESGSVRVVTDPPGADVWIDRADEPAGTTPVTVGNLAAGGDREHVLLLDKPGYLRPRPVFFAVSPGETTEISVPLEPAASPAVAVAVSSAIPGMAIYLDYLPTDETTPAEIGGMDPASHAGDLWFSASHSILLRNPSLSPFAPRVVPEWETDPGTLPPVAPESTPVLPVDAPNTWEWTWGDVTIAEKDKPDFSAPGSFGIATVRDDGVSPPPELPEGTTVMSIVVSDPVPGAFYTPFAAGSLGEPFKASRNSVRATGNDRELVFEIVRPPDDAAAFARVVVSVDAFKEGDPLPDGPVAP